MHPLRTLKSQAEEPVGYATRLTGKVIVLNEAGEVLLFGGLLLGGGIEEHESIEEGVRCECLEEAGVTIGELHPLGQVFQFRDVYKKRYEFPGFFANFVEQASDPTTANAGERQRTKVRTAIPEAIQSLRAEVERIEQAGSLHPETDAYQSELFNTQTRLAFLETYVTGRN